MAFAVWDDTNGTMVNLRLRGISTAIHSVDPDLKNILDEIRMITLIIVCHKSKSNGVWGGQSVRIAHRSQAAVESTPLVYVRIYYIHISIQRTPPQRTKLHEYSL